MFRHLLLFNGDEAITYHSKFIHDDDAVSSKNHQVSKTHIEMASKHCTYLCVKSVSIHYFMSSFAFMH